MLKTSVFSTFSVFNHCLTCVKLGLNKWLANPSQTIGRLTMKLSNKHIQKNPKTTKQEASLALAATTTIIHTPESIRYTNLGGE